MGEKDPISARGTTPSRAGGFQQYLHSSKCGPQFYSHLEPQTGWLPPHGASCLIILLIRELVLFSVQFQTSILKLPVYVFWGFEGLVCLGFLLFCFGGGLFGFCICLGFV